MLVPDVQLAAHLQLFFTYLTALLFFAEDSVNDALYYDDTLSFFLVFVNCGAFGLVALSVARGARSIAHEMREDRLVFADGVPIELRAPAATDGYHLFLSHV